MKRLACTIIVVTVLVSGLLFVRIAHGTTVSGMLTSDTEWTQLDSPVNLNGTLMVQNNATLTIDPGVTVNLGFYSLSVRGTLIAAGDANNQVSFAAQYVVGNSTVNNLNAPIFFTSSSTPWSDATDSGSIIQNAVLSGINLQINNASPKIDNCILNFGYTYSPVISINSGSPIISNNTFDYNGQGSAPNVNFINVFGGSPSITNNLFEGNYANSNTNGIMVTSGVPLITNNQFQGNGYLTAILASTDSPFTVSGNVFSDCLAGIKAQSRTTLTVAGNSFLRGTDGLEIAIGASLTVTNNLIDGNTRYGIDGGGYIDSNTITNNKIGIHNPPAGTVISNNNILGNTVNSITATTANIDAENNWWGISDAQTINQTIYDAKIDNHLGIITFVPFLKASNPRAPAIPAETPMLTPAPTPKIQPTSQPTITILTPTATPYQWFDSFVYQASTILNLSLITTATGIALILVWLIVVLGYIAKRSISRNKGKKEEK
jgi:hypothetical protein